MNCRWESLTRSMKYWIEYVGTDYWFYAFYFVSPHFPLNLSMWYSLTVGTWKSQSNSTLNLQLPCQYNTCILPTYFLHLVSNEMITLFVNYFWAMKFSDLRNFVFEMWESSRHINWRRQAASTKRRCMGHWVKNQFIDVINSKTVSVRVT